MSGGSAARRPPEQNPAYGPWELVFSLKGKGTEAMEAIKVTEGNKERSTLNAQRQSYDEPEFAGIGGWLLSVRR